MRIQIAARQCEIPESVRSRTEDQIGKLSKYEPRLSGAEVVFRTEKHLKKAEAVLRVHRGEPVVAGGEGGEFKEALDYFLKFQERKEAIYYASVCYKMLGNKEK